MQFWRQHLQERGSLTAYLLPFTPSERLILARESSCCLLIPRSYIPHIISPPATESLGDSAGAWSGQCADARLPRSRTDALRTSFTDWLFTCTWPALLSTRGKTYSIILIIWSFLTLSLIFWCSPAFVCHGVLFLTSRCREYNWMQNISMS